MRAAQTRPYDRSQMTMFQPIRNLLKARSARPRPATPAGERFYVVGDIHGCDALFAALVDAIEADDVRQPSARTTIVLLGDLVDRGPDSAGVIARARALQQRRTVRILAGNHEEMFLEAFDQPDVLRHFVKYGGRETILSYGLPRKEYNALTIEELFARLPQIVPQDDRDFIASFEDLIVAGDYAFVHAGVDPTLPIDQQSRRDMLWIRQRFLRHEGPYSHVVVHGHTIFDRVEDCGMRIGVDTGAYESGRLTALVLEGDTRRTITAVDIDGELTIEQEELPT